MDAVLHICALFLKHDVFICAVFAGRGGPSIRSGESGQHSCICGPPQPPTRDPGEAQRKWRVPRGSQDPAASSHQRPLRHQDSRHRDVKESTNKTQKLP